MSDGLNIADRLGLLQRKLGYSQKEFAQKAGLPIQPLNCLLRHERNVLRLPEIENISQLALDHGVSLDWLFLGRGSLKISRAARVDNFSHRGAAEMRGDSTDAGTQEITDDDMDVHGDDGAAA